MIQPISIDYRCHNIWHGNFKDLFAEMLTNSFITNTEDITQLQQAFIANSLDIADLSWNTHLFLFNHTDQITATKMHPHSNFPHVPWNSNATDCPA